MARTAVAMNRPQADARALYDASAAALHEIQSLVECTQAALAALIDFVANEAKLNQAGINRTVDALLTVDVVLDVVRERVDARHAAIEALFYRPAGGRRS